MMTPAFIGAVAFVLKEEGGLVDDPKDPGGLTKYGIALKRHPEMTEEQIRNLTIPQAEVIYWQKYWLPIHGDHMPWRLALCVFDAAVNSGPKRAIQWLQQTLGVLVDGEMGPKTEAAANSCNVAQTIRDYIARQLAFLQSEPGWEHDGHGWQARLDRVEAYA